MSDQTLTTDQSQNQGNVQDQTKQEPASKYQEHMIPKSRFDEVNEKYKDLQKQIDAMNKVNKDAEEARLAKEKNFEELANLKQQEIEKLKPLAAIAEELQKTAEEQLAAQVAKLPEHARSMVNDMELSTQGKLKWLSKYGDQLMKPKGPNVGAGVGGGEPPEAPELSDDELRIAKRAGMKPEEYAQWRSGVPVKE